MTTSNIFDVQASEPVDVKQPDGTMKRVHRSYVNLRLHVLAPTMERVVELMHEHYPEARLHQIIKRTSVSEVIVDPAVWSEVAASPSDQVTP